MPSNIVDFSYAFEVAQDGGRSALHAINTVAVSVVPGQFPVFLDTFVFIYIYFYVWGFGSARVRLFLCMFLSFGFLFPDRCFKLLTNWGTHFNWVFRPQGPYSIIQACPTQPATGVSTGIFGGFLVVLSPGIGSPGLFFGVWWWCFFSQGVPCPRSLSKFP